MDVTITLNDLNNDGEVSLFVPTDYFLYWGQELPSSPDSQLAIVPGIQGWTNTTSAGGAGNPAFFVEWSSTFTFSGFQDISGEITAVFPEVTLAAFGSYYSDEDPGDATIPVYPYVDLNSIFQGLTVEVIGSDANDSVAHSSLTSWSEFFSEQLIYGGDGDDTFQSLPSGISIVYGGAGDDYFRATEGGYSEFYFG